MDSLSSLLYLTSFCKKSQSWNRKGHYLNFVPCFYTILTDYSRNDTEFLIFIFHTKPTLLKNQMKFTEAACSLKKIE